MAKLTVSDFDNLGEYSEQEESIWREILSDVTDTNTREISLNSLKQLIINCAIALHNTSYVYSRITGNAVDDPFMDPDYVIEQVEEFYRERYEENGGAFQSFYDPDNE